MNILGIVMSTNSTAACMVDGEIVACVSEERFVRKKNHICYPRLSIEYCLRHANLRPRDIDLVAIAGNTFNADYWIVDHNYSFSVPDRIAEQYKYWKPRLLESKDIKFLSAFKDKIIPDRYTPSIKKMLKNNIDLRIKFIQEHLGIPPDRIKTYNHHDCHAYYGLYAGPFANRQAIIFTIEGWGDDANASVSIYDGENIVNKYRTGDFILGRLYRYMTLLLGLKPDEHEYKVMGLAPYAGEYKARPYSVFNNTMGVKGIGFRFKERPGDLYFWFKDRLEGYRFDAIASGLQSYTEEIICRWVKNCIKKFGIPYAAFSGGVAMNIKALMEVGLMEEVRGIYVPPTGSDESLAMGVLYKAMKDKGHKSSFLKPISNIYLGPEYDDTYVKNLLRDKKLNEKFRLKPNVTPCHIAKELTKGKIIALSRGRMEFGARALGNRSILADPRDTRIIKKINQKIKRRDFWMPFAPVIISEKAHRYLENPKGLLSPFMTMAFKTRLSARNELPAALHPADYTARPQILKRTENPFYYDIIKDFEGSTGVGALLNTSFNLHGCPIVCSPEDALHVFENSDLDGLILNNTFIEKIKR